MFVLVLEEALVCGPTQCSDPTGPSVVVLQIPQRTFQPMCLVDLLLQLKFRRCCPQTSVRTSKRPQFVGFWLDCVFICMWTPSEPVRCLSSMLCCFSLGTRSRSWRNVSATPRSTSWRGTTEPETRRPPATSCSRWRSSRTSCRYHQSRTTCA